MLTEKNKSGWYEPRSIPSVQTSQADNRSKGYREAQRSGQEGAGENEEPVLAWWILTDRTWAKGLIEDNDNE